MLVLMMAEEGILTAIMETMVIMAVMMTTVQRILEMQGGPLVMRLILVLVQGLAQLESIWI